MTLKILEIPDLLLDEQSHTFEVEFFVRLNFEMKNDPRLDNCDVNNALKHFFHHFMVLLSVSE